MRTCQRQSVSRRPKAADRLFMPGAYVRHTILAGGEHATQSTPKGDIHDMADYAKSATNPTNDAKYAISHAAKVRQIRQSTSHRTLAGQPDTPKYVT